jgi:hypothetical protein
MLIIFKTLPEHDIETHKKTQGDKGKGKGIPVTGRGGP